MNMANSDLLRCFAPLLVLLLVTCGSQEDSNNVRGALENFRELMAAEKYLQIYVETSLGFREKTGEDFLKQYLTAIDRKLGHHLSSQVVRSRITWSLHGPRWVMTYKSTFERGDATEIFVFVKEGNQIRISHYNIESADFAELRTTSGAHTLVQILIMRPQAGEVELISRSWELNQGYLDCSGSQEFSKRLKEVAGLPPLAEIWDKLMALEVSVWPSTNRGRRYAQFHSSRMMNSTFFEWETNGEGNSGIEIADFWEPIQDALFARELMASSQ